MRKLKIDLTEKHFDNWTIIEELGKGKVLAKCNCGVEKEMYKKIFIEGKHSKKCKHIKDVKFKTLENKNANLVGNIYGTREVIEELGKDRVRCRCSCGKKEVLYKGALKAGKYSQKCTHINNVTVGKRYGNLQVIDIIDSNRVLCKCECKNTKIIYKKYLKNGTTISCGCIPHINNDITHKRFDNWVVLRELGHNRLICRCDCGTEREIYKSNLLNGNTHSCGCMSSERKGLSTKTCEIIRDKEKLLEFIKCTWGDDKPTMYMIADRLEVSYSNIQSHILRYELHDAIDYKPMHSKEESEIVAYISKLTQSDIERNNRKVINGKELDIYIPELKLAIEFNGIYWHSNKFVEKEYHRNKVLEALQHDIRLVHIYECDWIDNKDEVKQLLKNVLSNNETYSYEREIVISLDVDNIKHYLYHGYTISEIMEPLCIYKTNNIAVYNSGYAKLTSIE